MQQKQIPKQQQAKIIQVVLILIIAAVVSYRAYQSLPDRVGADFVRFSNTVLTPALSLLPDTKRITAAKTAAETSEAYAKDFVPVYADKIQRLAAYQPKTPEVRRLRQQYLDGFQAMLQGYLDYTLAVQQKDTTKFASSAHDFLAGRATLAQAQQSGLALIKAHHLQIESKKKK